MAVHEFDGWKTFRAGGDWRALDVYLLLAQHEDRLGALDGKVPPVPGATAQLTVDHKTLSHIGNSGTTFVIDKKVGGSLQDVTLTGNATATIANMVDGDTVLVHVLTGAGSHTLTITGADWGAAGAPTFTAAANKRDIVVLRGAGGKIQANVLQGFAT